MKTRTLQRTRIIFSVGSFLAALILFGILIPPYGFLKTIGNHLSPDANIKSYTPVLYTTLRSPALIACLVFLLIGIGLVVFFNHGVPLSAFYERDVARPFDRVIVNV